MQTTLDLANMLYPIQGHFVYAPNQEESANQAQKANSISLAAAQHAHTNAKLVNETKCPAVLREELNVGPTPHSCLCYDT